MTLTKDTRAGKKNGGKRTVSIPRKKINLQGCNTAYQLAKMESEILDSAGNEVFEFTVEYLATARMLAKYAVLHGYEVSVKQPSHYEFIVTMKVDAVRKGTLVDEAVAGIDPNQSFHPEYIKV